jgi:formylglycine-generating enzyme required for sulfatase activity
MMGRDEANTRADYFPTGSFDEIPEHEVQLSPYLLDKYEVTVGRFRRFVEAYGGVPPAAATGAHPKIFGSGWDSDWNDLLPVDQAALRLRLRSADGTDNQDMSTWSEQADDGECRPMNVITWHLAFAFCVWDGGRLPTEAEWEFASSGGEQERFFPWGKAKPAGRAVFGCSYSGSLSCTAGDLPRVGSVSPAGDGRFGHADLAGSVAEFTRDAYDSAFYTSYQISNADPINLGFYGTDPPVVLRGGSAVVSGDSLRAAARLGVPISMRNVLQGFRCARNP